ncbi:hypothetical protein G8C92_14200 [Paenibacillus donghaensis]|uniref:extracellular solute-binding protein n=1 Tax=Paenibacillus donghaensis TaxID=414771 RepID=UPI0018839DDB|nr:extracellular solute-binding protein [Paenibacillus donghaensis]MBE9915180.1 hypothetical protein [Paenibacillus donghaensis]
MKSRVSKFLSCIMSIALIGGTLIACSDAKQDEGVMPSSEGNLLDGGITNATGFPITKEPITLTVGIANGAHMGDVAQYNLWKKIEEKTNIKINLKVYSDAEKANLMFSSRDYPDIGLRMDASDQAMSDAIDAGDIVGIDDLLQYAPSWKKFFDSNPEQKKQALMPDGKLYGFPYAVLNETSYNLRDQWFINKKWLDELGLQIPTTTEEFKNVLTAFKNNAGKGSIPKNVIPYYILYGNNIGGQFDMYGAFGVYTPGSYFIVEDGKYKSQATNPDLKEPIKYMADLYKNGLIVPEAFTDDWGRYTAAISSSPPLVGSMTSFVDQGQNASDGKWWTPMAPPKSPNGKNPFIRRQTKSIWPRNFVIFKKNKYPVASARLAELLADPEWSLSENFGSEGVWWKKSSDGKYELLTPTTEVADADKALGNYGIALLDEDMFNNKIVNDNFRKEGTREWAYENIYKKYLPEKNLNYPPMPSGLLSDEEKQRMTDLSQSLNDYIKTTIANWISGKGDIDAEWDGYVKKLKDLGLDEYMELNQKQLDAASKLGHE